MAIVPSKGGDALLVSPMLKTLAKELLRVGNRVVQTLLILRDVQIGRNVQHHANLADIGIYRSCSGEYQNQSGERWRWNHFDSIQIDARGRFAWKLVSWIPSDDHHVGIWLVRQELVPPTTSLTDSDVVARSPCVVHNHESMVVLQCQSPSVTERPAMKFDKDRKNDDGSRAHSIESGAR